MNQQQHRLLQVLRKISVFKGLELEHIQRLLRVGTSKVYSVGENIYLTGEPSLEMMVLLQGRLVVTNQGGDILGEIKPGTSTGEMGVFTGQPRSANISAAERSVAVVFKKAGLDTVLASNMTMRLRILDNMVALLSERLNAANKQNDKLLRRIEDLEEEIEETEGSENAPVEPPARNDLADEHDEFPDED
ncbi:MAG: CRP-like cAMP-binding protein [Candidatus Latescibacterota bacterium]|jgi:CRP-like cAMP-binding protein